ncbi:MAG: response regulator, partial [Oscillospiraceae bacterium]
MKKKRTVLVVDDNDINRKILRNILAEEYYVVEAEDGLQAIVQLEKMVNEVALILLDLVMPQMNGFEFMEELKKKARFSNIPVIVTTQKEGVETEIEVLSKGAMDFLTKPYNSSVIKHRVANTIKMIETAAIVNTLEHDSLTGLYNKDAFYRKISEVLEHSEDCEKFHIVCMDIDNFKLINDMYGEKQADEL